MQWGSMLNSTLNSRDQGQGCYPSATWITKRSLSPCFLASSSKQHQKSCSSNPSPSSTPSAFFHKACTCCLAVALAKVQLLLHSCTSSLTSAPAVLTWLFPAANWCFKQKIETCKWLHTPFIRKLIPSSHNYVFLNKYFGKGERISFPGSFGTSVTPFICIQCVISSIWKLRVEEVNPSTE